MANEPLDKTILGDENGVVMYDEFANFNKSLNSLPRVQSNDDIIDRIKVATIEGPTTIRERFDKTMSAREE